MLSCLDTPFYFMTRTGAIGPQLSNAQVQQITKLCYGYPLAHNDGTFGIRKQAYYTLPPIRTKPKIKNLNIAMRACGKTACMGENTIPT